MAYFSRFPQKILRARTCTSVSSRAVSEPLDPVLDAVKVIPSFTLNGEASHSVSRILRLTVLPNEDAIPNYYRVLYRAWGPQHWWPAESQFEVIVGAYLTQNTAWTNVERALENLRDAQLLHLDGIRRVRIARLERLIRPSGFFRQKAQRLKTFVKFLDKQYEGSIEKMFSQSTDRLREELLHLNGVGPETADSTLLYAGNHPVFVVDAYTRRILDRHQILGAKADYEEIRKFFERALGPLADEQKNEQQAEPATQLDAGFRGARHPPSAMSSARRTALVQVYNEMHGLIVGVGKHYCRTNPACETCPLRPFLPNSYHAPAPRK